MSQIAINHLQLNGGKITMNGVTKLQSKCRVQVFEAKDFDQERIFDKKVLSGKVHSKISEFFRLSNEEIISRYQEKHPQINADALRSVLQYRSTYFHWAGSDLMKVTSEEGHKRMIVVETNSCPSGAKYMTFDPSKSETGAYGKIIEQTFQRVVNEKADPSLGGIAVVCDKNAVGTTGYAMTIAKLMKEKVWLVEFYDKEHDVPVRWSNGVLFIRDDKGSWHPIRACFRYLTQKPWNRFPIHSKTLVINNVLACLCGGRNKMMASYAYEFLNRELFGTGLQISIPETLCDVSKVEIPRIINEMNGLAVIKVPYSNAGQGVYTITSNADLDDFMEVEHDYDKFIVQSLVGHRNWNRSKEICSSGRFYHVGMVPNEKGQVFVYDLRFIITASSDGWFPVAMYARRARSPLEADLAEASGSSWEVLGTNLSFKCDGKWKSEVSRLLVMDEVDFARLGLSLDDLIDGYIQTVLSVTAIDKMCHRVAPKGIFDMKLFHSYNPDAAFLEEILVGDI